MNVIRLPIALLLGLALPALAAINPAEYKDGAPEVLQLRELSRVVQEDDLGGTRPRRVTIVAEVLAAKFETEPRVGRIIVIDYRTDLAARAAAGKRHADLRGTRPGPQFLHDPDPPVPDAEGRFWAHLARADSPEARKRYAGAMAGGPGYQASANVFVPFAAQYSFDPVR